MANTLTKVENTVPLGGHLKMRIQEMSISNYDDDAAGDGEAFAPADVNMRRFTMVIPIVTDAAAVEAQYDEGANAVRLFRQANDGTGTANDPLVEAPSNSNVSATVKLICVGV